MASSSLPSSPAARPPPAALEATINKLQALALQSHVPSHHVPDGLEIEVDGASFASLEFEDRRSCTPELDEADEPIFAFLNSADDAVPPRSPTLHSRRLTASLPDDLRANLVLPRSPFSSFSSFSCLGLRAISDDRYSTGSSGFFTPFSARSAPGSASPEGEDPSHESESSGDLRPFFPVIPMLQDQHETSVGLEAQMTPRSSPHGSPPVDHPRIALTDSAAQRKKHRHHAALASSHSNLLQLASLPSSFGFLGSPSGPSSAGSSCPASPDLGAQAGASLSPLTQLDSFVLHTPDSPTWKPATLAHQSSMELSQLRRAREAFKGKESISRMKMIGLSSRAQQAQHVSAGSRSPATRRDFEYDSSGVSDSDTPSPINTPTSFARHRLAQPLLHRVKPLMSSHGHLQMQAMLYHSTSAPGLHAPSPPNTEPPSVAAAPPSLLASVPLTRVDPELVANYLQPLSAQELHATVHPIRALLPWPTAETALESATPSASASSSSSSPSDASVASASPAASPSSSIPSFSVASVPSLSNLHLSLLLCRCIARSHWRKTIPSDLLHLSFECLDVSTLLVQVTRVSKYWRGAAKELTNTSSHWQQEVLKKQDEVRRRQKLKLYRRLTPADLQMQHLLQPIAQRAD